MDLTAPLQGLASLSAQGRTCAVRNRKKHRTLLASTAP